MQGQGQRDRDMLQGWGEDQDGRCRLAAGMLAVCSWGDAVKPDREMCMDRMEVTLKAFATQAFGGRLSPGWAGPGRGRLKW